MQDFTFAPYEYSPGERNSIGTFPPEEELVSSPEKMYMLSLSTRSKLPERLHNAMLLWSFDSKSAHYVQLYLDWSSHCEEMNAYRERFRRRCEVQDRMMLYITIMTGLTLLVVLVTNAFK